MSDKRRAEIEAKRAKLAELRKIRADRQKADAEKRANEVCQKHHSHPALSPLLTGHLQPGNVPSNRRDVDDLLSALVGTTRGGDSVGDLTPLSSIPGTPPFAPLAVAPGQPTPEQVIERCVKK
jgi:dynein intermediate chain